MTRLRFVAGLAVGLVLGAAGSAVAQRVVGGDGYLTGWLVTDNGGEEICSDPFIWTGTHEIECN